MNQLSESQESSSPIVTRALAAARRGQPVDIYQLAAWQKTGMRALGRLPQPATLVIPSHLQLLGGQGPRLLLSFSRAHLIRA